MKSVFLFFSALVLSSASIGQDVYNIADGGSFTFQCSSGSAIVTDSGGEGSDYGPDESHEITFCLGDGVAGNLEVVLSPELYGQTWDVDDESFVFIHDGPSTASPLIGGGMFNTFNDPSGFLVSLTQGCVTIAFESGSGSSGQGFSAFVRCETFFQPFDLEFTADPAFESTSISDQSIALCFTDSFFVSASTSYPLSDASGNGYEQSDETSYFNWQMGDGVSYQGFGLTEIAHSYDDGSGYQVNLSVIDVSGTIEYFNFFVLQSPRPNFSNVAVDDTLCIGEVTDLTGGINVTLGDTVGVDNGTGAILGGGTVGGQESVVDADPNDCDAIYSIPLEIGEFEEGQTLTNIDDVLNICVNMWHTFLGDLELGLVCPNANDTLVLFDMMDTQGQCDGMFDVGPNGSGRDLGNPGAMPIPVGFDYCWNNEPEFGTFAEEDDAQPPGSMAAGTYETMTDISGLLGCPLNGTWQLLIKDSYQADVGLVNSWSLFINPDINPSTEYYNPQIVDAGWDDNPDLVVSDDSTSVTVTPSEEGDNSFTFFAFDEFGCRHDTTILVYVRPDVIISDNIACDLSHELFPENAPNGGVWELLEGPNATSESAFIADEEFGEFGAADMTVNDYGLYEVEITENNCSYRDTAIIDFRPDPIIAPFVEDTVLCIGASIFLNAGPQEDNSDNFDIFWTRDNGLFNSEDYGVTVDQTGLYILNIDGFCASASDTSDVVAIQLEFEGDTLCGLDRPGVQVLLEPEGTGTWSSPAGNISFGNPNGLTTSINSTQYGEFDATFTDSRCPNDGETRVFRFVEQPVVNILPEQPDFCVDLDSLNLQTVVEGNSTGNFTWTVSGVPSNISAGEIGFGPEEFEPLETHVIEVRTNDNFGVCPVAAGSISFFGQWCTYNIPNVITPNGDGRNDTWDIEFIEFFPGTQVRVFNRWGQQVFENNDYDSFQNSRGRGWDPEDLKEGVYFYELLVPAVDKVESGNLTILRESNPNRR